MRNNLFLSEALREIPRLLGQINRNPLSDSYGSFDRAYWHYRTNDISCARYQEALYTLTLLYARDFEGNSYYRDAQLLLWVRASLRFTARLQRQNGSFDEWYVNESSYVATAFVTAAVGQALLVLRECDSKLPEEPLILEMLCKAADFLLAHQEEVVLNQVAGAIFALCVAGELHAAPELKGAAAALCERFVSLQSKEGWWSEYGGPDTGYLSLTVSYLDKYRALAAHRDTDEAIARAVAFIRDFVHPDLTAGGEYCSRNTEYLIPSPALPHLGALRPVHLDDRYLCYILYNWLETGHASAPQPLAVTPGERYYPESGLLRVVGDRYALFANSRKGGAFRLYAGDKTYYDSGLEIAAEKKLSSGMLNAENVVSFASGTLHSNGRVCEIAEPLLATPRAVLFKLWQWLFGRLPLVAFFVKKFLRVRMVSGVKNSPLSFKRSITYSPTEVVICDTLYPAPKAVVGYGTKAAYSAVPSSKYAALPELASLRLAPTVEEVRGDSYTLKRRFSFTHG